MMGGAQGGGLGGENEGEGEMGFDKMTDMLLNQFMDRELLYEPLSTAREEISKAIKENKEMPEEDRTKAIAQKECIDELIDLFDNEPENKEKMITVFEKLNQIGSLFELIQKYAPESSLNKEGTMNSNPLFGGSPMPGMPGMGGMPGMPGMGGPPNPEDCRLI